MRPYPLTKRFLAVGVFLGAATGLFLGAPLAGYAVAVLCVIVGVTWRRDSAPVFPYILATQWLQVTCGYFFSLATGDLPGHIESGSVDWTVAVSLTGLLVMTSGIRVAEQLLQPRAREETEIAVGNLRGLFFLAMALYAVNYVSAINTKLFFAYDQILDRILVARQIPLLVLWFEVLRRRQHREYLWISLIFAVMSSFGSYFSDFKTPLLLALIVSAAAWRPWETTWWHFKLGGVVRVLAIAATVVFLALVWQAGVKKDTRRAYDENAVGSNARERIEFVMASAETAVPKVFNDTRAVVEGLIARIWYVEYFSFVLNRVPYIEPHAGGELLWMAIQNATMPRFLFPEKAVLPSDSYYTRRFAGIQVAEGGITSIGIGYMAEFYADWGFAGMFISVFAFGGLMGAGAGLVRTQVRPHILINPAVMTVLLPMATFEGQFIKSFAGLIVSVSIIIAIVRVCRTPFASFLRLEAPAVAPDPVRRLLRRPVLT